MDINYDPSEEVADEVDGGLDYDPRLDIWIMLCSEHGEIARSADGSAAGHDEMIHKWTAHVRQEHHGDGIMLADDRAMLIGAESGEGNHGAVA